MNTLKNMYGNAVATVILLAVTAASTVIAKNVLSSMKGEIHQRVINSQCADIINIYKFMQSFLGFE